MDLIRQNNDQLIALCRKHRVKELYLFGSILSNKFNESSDVDFLIQFQDIALADYFDNYMELKEELEKLLKRPVDLVENQAIKNPIFRRTIEREKQLVYGREIA